MLHSIFLAALLLAADPKAEAAAALALAAAQPPHDCPCGQTCKCDPCVCKIENKGSEAEYALACKQAIAEDKPLAVYVGFGPKTDLRGVVVCRWDGIKEKEGFTSVPNPSVIVAFVYKGELFTAGHDVSNPGGGQVRDRAAKEQLRMMSLKENRWAVPAQTYPWPGQSAQLGDCKDGK